MSRTQPTGWRSMPPAMPMVRTPPTDDKTQLFEAARICAQALNLAPGCRYVLEQLCAVYGGELIEDRMLVWPSNEFLVERTGIPERTIRFALRKMIELGVIAAKDSANGKRFAQRSAQGQIVRAYGFDLSPLLNRLGEFRAQLAAVKEQERERQVAFDELTIHRRSAMEALRTIAEWFPDLDITEITARALELARRSPRRSSKGSTEPFRTEWEQLRQEAESLYYTACGGNNRRHEDHNKYAPDQSCNNGREENVGLEPPALDANAADLARACPDAMEFFGPLESDRALVEAAGRLRGAFGVSPSAWDEARREIGPLAAAATLVYVVQMQARPAPGSKPIKNTGGYYRAMCRLIKEGRVNLAAEVRRLLRRT